MLLIAGGESDPNTQRIVDQAHIRALDYLFWDTDDDNCLNIAWDFNSPDLDLGERRIKPSSIFIRWNVFGGDSDRNLAAHETLQAYAFAWPDVRMLNRKTSTDTNNKSYNLRLAREVGFSIPDTLVMSNLAPLRTVPDAQQRIAKPLSGGTHTKDVSILAVDEDAIADSKPQFIQTRLEGENLRLFSVDGQLFCFHLVTSALDYREDNAVQVVRVEVPDAVVNSTRELVRRKGFDYCALDFRCRQRFDDPIFLEVNSFPMFVRFDDAGENCIVNAVLNFLCQG